MWKFDAPYEVQNIENYNAAVEECKKQLINLNEQITFALEQKKLIESGNDELSKLRMDKIYERENLTEMGEQRLSKEKTEFAEQQELLEDQRKKLATALDNLAGKQSDFLSEIKFKTDNLISWENELHIKESGLRELADALKKKDEEHAEVSDQNKINIEKIVADFDAIKEQAAELDNIRTNMLVDKEMLDKQKTEIASMCDQYNATLEEIKKTKNEAELLKRENLKKSQDLSVQAKQIRELIIEQRRLEAENFKKAEFLRNEEARLVPHIQKLEELKDHIAQTGGAQ